MMHLKKKYRERERNGDILLKIFWKFETWNKVGDVMEFGLK